MNTTAIAIFVKTPELSPVKTRLAASIGPDKATQFYRLSVQAIEETVAALCAVSTVTPYWAVAEKKALDSPMWSNFTVLHAGSEDLGLTQHRIYQQLLETHHRVILIGADSPQLTTVHLQQAINSLDNNHFAIGPALDGGYYLFAGKAPINQRVWTSVQYSAATTRSQLSQGLPFPPVSLEMLTDVDQEEDLALLLEHLSMNSCHQVQGALKTWLQSVIGSA